MPRHFGESLLVVLALSGLAACAEPVPVPEGCVLGVLSNEGATCQAMRDGEDRLYSFYADMTGYAIGEQVCVCGPVAEMSFCNQGIVLEARHLDRTCPPVE